MPIIIPGNRLASTGHTISQSIRFNDDDSPYMSRTQQAGNQTTWTISCWIKIGNLPGSFTIWSVHTGYQSYAQIKSSTGLEFAVGNGSSSASYHALLDFFVTHQLGIIWLWFLILQMLPQVKELEFILTVKDN